MTKVVGPGEGHCSLQAPSLSISLEKLESRVITEFGIAGSCLPPALISTARSKQRQAARTAAKHQHQTELLESSTSASKPSALNICPIGFMMARSPHVSIGCHDSHGSQGSHGSVLLHHGRRETADKTCPLPRSLRCPPCQLSRNVREQVISLSSFFLSFSCCMISFTS
jgi:hypothetical protein